MQYCLNLRFYIIADFGKKNSTYEIDYLKYEICMFWSLHMSDFNLLLDTSQKLLSLVRGLYFFSGRTVCSQQ